MGSKNSSPIGGYYPTASNTNSSAQSTSTGTQSVSPDPLAGLSYLQVLQNAATIANTPYQQYQGQQVAGFVPDTMAGFQNVRNMQGVQNPYLSQSGNLYQQSTNQWQNPYLPKSENYFGQSFGAAINPYLPRSEGMYNQSFGYIPNTYMGQVGDYTSSAMSNALNTQMPSTQDYFQRSINAAQNPFLGQSQGYVGESVGVSDQDKFNQQALNQYMNPFQSQVIDATLGQMKQNQDVLQAKNTSDAIRQGSFGGSGQFLGQAELGRQQALANAQTLAGLNAQNYQQAMGQYNQQQEQAIRARQQAAQLLSGMGQQQAGLNVNALQQAGQTLGQLGQSQAQLLAGTGMDAARMYGDLGNQLAQRGIQAYQNAAQTMGQLGGQQAGLLTNAYQNAAQTMGQLGQSQQQLGVNALQGAASGVAGLGKQAQQAALTDAQALMETGQMQRALQQQQLDAAFKQWQEARAYPYQQTSYFGGLAQGLGPLLGSYQNSAQQGSSSGTNVGQNWQPYQNQSGGGGWAGLATSGLGLLGSLFRGGFADGGSVTERTAKAGGGSFEDEVLSAPYGKGPIDLNAGFGPLMLQAPYADAPNYIAQAEKMSDIVKPAKALAAEKMRNEIDNLLDIKKSKSEGPESEIKSKFFGSEGQDSGEDYVGLANKALGLMGRSGSKEEASSDTGFGFGSLFDNLSRSDSSFKDGGRVHKEDGGSFYEQAQRVKQPQQQAQQIIDEFQKYVGRAPEQGGFEYWADLAAKGMSPEERVGYIRGAPERMQNIREAFVDYLGRAPTVPEYADYANRIRGGLSFADLQNAVKQTPESMYRNMLGRPGEPGGLAYWNALQGRLDPTQMELYFADTPEYKARTQTPPTLGAKVEKGWESLDPSGGMNKALAREKMVAPLDLPKSNYEMLLKQAGKLNPGPQLTPEQQGMPSMPSADDYNSRSPSYPGVGGGNLNLAQSMSVPAIAAGGTSTDQHNKFIETLYRNYLGREAAPSEVQAYVNVLKSGKSPAEVEAELRQSPEGINTQYVQSMYNNLLGRSSGFDGLQFWKEQLKQGLPAADLASVFAGTQEYQDTPAMFRSNAPVQGYFTSIANNQFNPSTGLFNLEFNSPYRGTTPGFDLSSALGMKQQLNDAEKKSGAKDGGRISKKSGGGLSGKGLYDYLISLGANAKEAAMLTGNAKVESSFNPSVMHDNNTGYGLWGHGKDRWADMRKFTGEAKPGWEDQAKFALWELRNSPKTAMARQALARADDARDVAIAGMHFERPRGYTPATPWLGMNYQQRYANVASLMGGKDIGSGPEIRMAGNEPSSGALSLTPRTPAPRRGLLSRIIHELAPVSTAEAAESQPAAESKPMFAWPKLRNFQTNDLPTALGMNQPELPAWKKEVQTGFGALGEDRPADQAQLLAEPSQHTAMGPEMEVPVPPKRSDEFPVVAEDREDQKYYGDWRDQDPWKSDPIGGFFDALSGQEKKADEPGKEEQDSGFGDLFNFAKGGIVRKHYAVGGGEDEGLGNPLEELGAMVEEGFGGLFGGGEEAPAPEPASSGFDLGSIFGGGKEAPKGVVAADTPAGVVASDEAPSRGFMSPAVSDALIAAGLGMMASPARDPLRAIGEGGLKGFQVYSELSEQQRKRDLAAAQQRSAAAYEQRLSGTPMAEDKEETASGQGTVSSGTNLDSLMGKMERISAVPATTPQQIQQKNAALRNLQTRITIAEKVDQHKTGKIGTIGKDEFNNPITGYISGPNAGKTLAEVRGEERQGAGEEGPKAIDWNKTGEEFLTTLPADIQDEVKGIAEGRLDIPKGPKAQGVWKAVTRYSPGFDMTVYGARKKMRDSYADQSGTKPGAQITAGNTAIGHAGELSDLIIKLNNYDTDIINKPINWVKERYGGEAAQTLNKYRSLVDKYVDEQTSFYKGRGGGGIEERRESRERLDPSKGTKVLLDTLRGDQEAMGSKVSELEEAWNRTMGKGQSVPIESYDVISKHGKEGKALLEHNFKVASGDAKPVRTGRTKDGRKVTQYSDGYIKYGD
jgi:hypothetical protein